MALHTELQIYRDTVDLMKRVIPMVRNFPRDVKLIAGNRLLDKCFEITDLVYAANVAKDKGPAIERLRQRVQAVELSLRLSKDLQFISVGQYSSVVKLTQGIGRQATGWLKHSNKSPAG